MRLSVATLLAATILGAAAPAWAVTDLPADPEITKGLAPKADKPAEPVDMVDRVQALAGDLPEPADWALMILGFGGAGAVLRAQRRRSSQA